MELVSDLVLGESIQCRVVESNLRPWKVREATLFVSFDAFDEGHFFEISPLGRDDEGLKLVKLGPDLFRGESTEFGYVVSNRMPRKGREPAFAIQGDSFLERVFLVKGPRWVVHDERWWGRRCEWFW